MKAKTLLAIVIALMHWGISTLNCQEAAVSDDEILTMARNYVKATLVTWELEDLIHNQLDRSDAISIISTRDQYDELSRTLALGNVMVKLDSIIEVNDSCRLSVFRFSDDNALHGRSGYLAISQKGVPYRISGFNSHDIDSLVVHCYGYLSDEQKLFDLSQLIYSYVAAQRGEVVVNDEETFEKYKQLFPTISLPRFVMRDFEQWVTFYTVKEGSGDKDVEIAIHKVKRSFSGVQYDRIVVRESEE